MRSINDPGLKIENINIAPDPEFPCFALLRGEYTPVSSTNPRLAIMHFHNLIEIGYCSAGSGSACIDGKTFPYKAGDVSFVPAQAAHYYKDNSVDDGKPHFWEYFYFDLDSFLSELFHDGIPSRDLYLRGGRLQQFIFSSEDNKEIVDCVTSILDEMRERRPNYQMMVRILTSSLLLSISRLVPDTVETVTPNKISVMPAIVYIHDHFNETIYIEELADLCFMSPASFRRKFKEATGHTALEAVNSYRILKACEFLTHSDMSIKEISAAVGFDSVSGFCRRFADVMGITPLKWKNSSTKYADSEK